LHCRASSFRIGTTWPPSTYYGTGLEKALQGGAQRPSETTEGADGPGSRQAGRAFAVHSWFGHCRKGVRVEKIFQG